VTTSQVTLCFRRKPEIKEALSTSVLCAHLFLVFPRIQFIARPIVGRPTFAAQAVFYDKAGASAREILCEIWKKIQTPAK